MKPPLRYKRVLLKVSGEALLGKQSFGIDDTVLARIAGDIAAAVKLGVKLGIVTGGGNIYRGISIQKAGGNRVAGDQMGMLATVLNSIALQQKLGGNGPLMASALGSLGPKIVCVGLMGKPLHAVFEKLNNFGRVAF